MNYITAKQFLELPEESQYKFKKWAEENFQEWDLIYDTEIKEIRHIEQVLDTRNDSIDVGRVFYFGMDIFWTPIYCPEAIPLFRLDHLWGFIEDTTEEYIHIELMPDDYLIKTVDSDEILSWETDDRLQAFWKAAVKVASGHWRDNID